MAVNVNDKIRKLSPDQRKKVEARAAELIAEEMSLRDLRKALDRTQADIADRLGVGHLEDAGSSDERGPHLHL